MNNFDKGYSKGFKAGIEMAISILRQQPGDKIDRPALIEILLSALGLEKGYKKDSGH